MGQLIPVMCDEVVPGDVFQIGCQGVIRFQPLVAPILHEVNCIVHYFFVPTRLLWDSWEEFITGGINGTFSDPPPLWEPTNTAEGSLWDYMGFPTGVDPDGAYPLDFCRRSYNLVYNQYYRDETLTPEVLLTNESILNCKWEKDYFTSALPWQQRGIAPALPITGTGAALWDMSSFDAGGSTGNLSTSIIGTSSVMHALAGYPDHLTNTRSFFNSNTVDFSTASTFDVADLRLTVQIQKWMERNARAGVRYVEFLGQHFGVNPRDDRLQRAEYIGGAKNPVIFSEVLQTSSTDATSAQGNLAGHGLSINNSYCGRYVAQEFGYILGVMRLQPTPSYQQGIDRQWLRRSRYDFYFPEFANLSEQAILNAEILATGNPIHNAGLWGYQGRYDEMRTKSNMIVGQMRSTFDYWHLGRIFDPLTPPVLNDEFLTCSPRKDIFAVPSEPGLIVSWANIIKAYRPLPKVAEPGLLDHN